MGGSVIYFFNLLYLCALSSPFNVYNLKSVRRRTLFVPIEIINIQQDLKNFTNFR